MATKLVKEYHDGAGWHQIRHLMGDGRRLAILTLHVLNNGHVGTAKYIERIPEEPFDECGKSDIGLERVMTLVNVEFLNTGDFQEELLMTAESMVDNLWKLRNRRINAEIAQLRTENRKRK